MIQQDNNNFFPDQNSGYNSGQFYNQNHGQFQNQYPNQNSNQFFYQDPYQYPNQNYGQGYNQQYSQNQQNIQNSQQFQQQVVQNNSVSVNKINKTNVASVSVRNYNRSKLREIFPGLNPKKYKIHPSELIWDGKSSIKGKAIIIWEYKIVDSLKDVQQELVECVDANGNITTRMKEVPKKIIAFRYSFIIGKDSENNFIVETIGDSGKYLEYYTISGSVVLKDRMINQQVPFATVIVESTSKTKQKFTELIDVDTNLL